uniref:IRS-type PTB domain-containing protein n=1 Tax=Steinernema glaseri TaxID=37863 RepID=A0A1I7Y0Z2_9BILA
MSSYHSPRFVDNSDDIKTFTLDKYTRVMGGKDVISVSLNHSSCIAICFKVDESQMKSRRRLEIRISASRGILRLIHDLSTLEEFVLSSETVAVKSRDRRLVFVCQGEGSRAFRVRFTSIVEHQMFCDLAARFVTISDEGSRAFRVRFSSIVEHQMFCDLATRFVTISDESNSSSNRSSQFSSTQRSSQLSSTQRSLFSNSSGSQNSFPPTSVFDSPAPDKFVFSPRKNSERQFARSFSQQQRDMETFTRAEPPRENEFRKRAREPSPELEIVKCIDKPTSKRSMSLKERREEHRRNWKGPGLEFPPVREPSPPPEGSAHGFRAPRIGVLDDVPVQFSLPTETTQNRSALYRAFQYVQMDPSFEELLNVVRQLDEFGDLQRFREPL